MIRLEKINIAKTQEYIQTIYSRRIALFNYFGQTIEKDDKYFETNDTFILAKPVRDFHRIYVASNDKKELVEILSNLEGTNVINFPTKGDIRDVEAIMTESGFEQISVFDSFLLNVEKLEFSTVDISTITVATEQDVDEIYNLYSSWKDFNPYIDWLLTHKELKELVGNKTVLINKQDGKILGTTIFSINKKIFRWHLLIDLSGNAIKLVAAMLVIARENGTKFFRSWVNILNEKSNKFNTRLGAIPDGLRDYTYIKR